MKSLIVTVTVALTSSAAFASGFECTGQGFNVKMYNQVQPSRGTKNPAVLVVSAQGRGTLAVLKGDEIIKQNGQDSVVYSGMANGYQDGRFAQVSLRVLKQPVTSGGFTGKHFGRLVVNENNHNWTANLACDPYLKN